jgi:hypothetical protein
VLAQALDLLDGDLIRLVGRQNALDIERSRPAVPAEAELGQPLVRPARDDRLAGRVAGGVVVEATPRTGLSVVARPHAAIHGVNRLAIGQGLARQQRTERRLIEPTVDEGGIDAPPTAAVRRYKAEVDGRGDGISRRQGIDELEEGIAALREAGVDGVAEVAERDMAGIHARKCATIAGRAATASPSARQQG